jgi:hypothetical protein
MRIRCADGEPQIVRFLNLSSPSGSGNSRENVSPENSSRKSNSRKLVGIEVPGFASARGHPDVLGALIVKKSGADWSSLVRDSPLDRPQRLNKARD